MTTSARSTDLFDVDGVVDLYGLDPSEFVAARAALAKRLRGEGDKAAAAEVARLRKPSVVAAALNRVARTHADEVEELLAASEALADAQRATLLGGDAEELRATAGERRRLLSTVAGEATGIVGAARAAEVSATLEAALADDARVADLRRGTLTDTLSAPAGFGFGVGEATVDDADLPVPARAGARAEAASPAGAPAPSAADERARRAAERERRRAATARVEAARSELEHGERELRQAEAELGAAQEALASARDRVGEATARCDSLAAAVQAAEAALAALPDG